MARRKGEIMARMNERDCPHIVIMPVPPFGFGSALNAMHAWHRKCGIQSKRGGGHRDEKGVDHVRWCFADAETADAFAGQFGGRRLNPAGPKPKDPYDFPSRQ
jgi:hypothetical protein